MISSESPRPVAVSVTVPLSLDAAFAAFLRSLNRWWPKEYTWSGELLELIAIEPKIGGACYELGPHGFRCDWGHVVAYGEPNHLRFRWQISFLRAPVPNPGASSEVDVRFETDHAAETSVDLVHDGFERHGEDGQMYRDAMASKAGWPWIISLYREFAEQLAREDGAG